MWQERLFTNASGYYSFYTQAGSFDITPSIENPTWFNFSPTTATIPFADNNNNTATQDFCIAPSGFSPRCGSGYCSRCFLRVRALMRPTELPSETKAIRRFRKDLLVCNMTMRFRFCFGIAGYIFASCWQYKLAVYQLVAL